MKFSVNRELLLKPLQQVAGVVERRQTLPVLSNVLIQVVEDSVSLTGTDLEVELIRNRIGLLRSDPFDYSAHVDTPLSVGTGHA